MGMTSYEVVRRAVAFDRPDRLPLCFELLGLNDFHAVMWNRIGSGDRDRRQTVDEWGCLWQRTEMENMGQVKGHPLEDWGALRDYRWPDADDPQFYEGMDERFEGSDGKYITTDIFMLIFERMHSLHGFQNTLADLYLERERMEMLANRIVEFDLGIIENIHRRFPGQIHGLTFTDDWGTEQATFVNPGFWTDFFKPRYKQIFDACHDIGWTVHMHSCGKVNEIIPGLIEIGLDSINLQQPRALGIEEIGSRFRGKICFDSLCDIQATLPFEDADAIREEAHLLLREWATSEGGFILSDYGDGPGIGVSDEKKRIMLEAFLDADPWK
jgi:uroporphyrinogen decarboxylase